MFTPALSSRLPCPHCAATDKQRKIGTNRTGSQRFECQHCRKTYTPHPKHAGCAPALKKQAVLLYADDLSLRRIARTLGVHHQSIANWVNALTLPPAARPAAADVVELDELYTFVGHKKTPSISAPP